MSRIYPSELELLILNVLWDAKSSGDSPLPVRDVRDRLQEAGRDLAHTTVITTLNVMLEKKFVTRKPRKNAFLFAAKVTRESVGKKEMGKLLDRVFAGSATSLMQALLSTDEVSTESIAEMKKLIDQAASLKISAKREGKSKTRKPNTGA